MYSIEFVTYLERYLETSSVMGANGQDKFRVLSKMLKARFGDSLEASDSELKSICSQVDIQGNGPTVALVRSATTGKDLKPSEKSQKAVKTRAAKRAENVLLTPAPSKYMVCSGYDPDKLEARVNDMLRKGDWHLAGGVSVAVRNHPNVEVLYSQALFKY